MNTNLSSTKISIAVNTVLGCLTAFSIFIPTGAKAFTVVDSINADKSPSSPTWGVSEVGWSYTPTFSYGLSAISTKFGASVDARTVTVEVYDNAPSLGGVLLRSAGFSPLPNAFSGGAFLPLNLVAGEDYFIGFRNVGGLGVNVTADSGAIDLDPLRFSVANNGSYSGSQSGFTTNSPILQFSSEAAAIPTPALLPGLIGMGAAALRKRKQEAEAEA